MMPRICVVEYEIIRGQIYVINACTELISKHSSKAIFPRSNVGKAFATHFCKVHISETEC